MSNPGVISLAANPKFKLKIEDNIAEAIHIHYENIRLDLTVEEFEKLAGCMNNVIDEIVSVEGFSSFNINPNDLIQIAEFLPKLLKTEKDEVFIDKLLVDNSCGKYISVKKAKDLIADNEKIYSDNEQIILFANKNIVICGQEQCKKLYKSQGNIKIPVTRLFFDETVRISNFQKKPQKTPLIKRFIKIIKWIIRHIMRKV